MTSPSAPEGPPAPAAPERAPRRRFGLRLVAVLLAAWAVGAYLLVPWVAKRYYTRHGVTFEVARVTVTADDHPGDPVNLAIEGSEEQLVRAMTAAGWHPADPITLASSIRIAIDSVLRRPDDQAPVSNLFLFGRKQDLAFEQPVGDSPRQRHHVRFWRWDQTRDGRPVFFGSATFDERVGLSHATGQVTHHIGPDVDAERERIASELEKAGWAEREYYIDGFHKQLEGRNGGDDPWRTDGRLGVVVLRPSS
jgi:hypothetical protein